MADHVDRLDRHPLDERRLTQPAALRSAGWRVVRVLSTEWISDPDAVLDTIVDQLAPSADDQDGGGG